MSSRNSRPRVVLTIVDGFGISAPSAGNAVTLAKTPAWDELRANHPHIALDASSQAVGLPGDTMGNSEVGHLTIGSGRIIFQSLERINQSCNDGSFAENPIFRSIQNHLAKTNGSLHIMGLLSDGKVHSSLYHLNSILGIVNNLGLDTIWFHGFTDGRDTPPTSGVNYLKKLVFDLEDIPKIKIGTIIGRYYAMDRDTKWDRTTVAFEMLVNLSGNDPGDSLLEYVNSRYAEGNTDEFLRPVIVNDQSSISPGDAVIFFNFRPDRARQLTMALTGLSEHFEKISNLYFVSMVPYDESWNVSYFFDSVHIQNCLAQVLADNQISQLHVAETEKYAHVTYFLNGGNEKPFKYEERQLIPSLRIATYDLEPTMSTLEISQATVLGIKSRNYDFVVLNIASPDMVGHTGDIEAAIKAIESMDKALSEIYAACLSNGYTLIITSDHGNAEKMLHDGKKHTAHTQNKVPFLITGDVELSGKHGLSCVAPTILHLLGITKPDDMTGFSAIKD